MKEDILKELEPLFERARKEKLWFYCSYQDMWLSPDELEKAQTEGRFIWGACNWELRNPIELIRQKRKLVDVLENQCDEIIDRMENAQKPTTTNKGE